MGQVLRGSATTIEAIGRALQDVQEMKIAPAFVIALGDAAG